MKQKTQAGFAHVGLIFLVILILGVVGGTGYYVYHKNHDKKTDSAQQQPSDSDDKNATTSDGWSQPVASGKNAYTVSFPNGWNVLRDDASDSFMVSGEAQPTANSDQAAKITTTTFGGDGAFIFFAGVQDKSEAPQGIAKDFTLVNGKDHPIKGKKYVYEYEVDTPTSFTSEERIKGDRDYTYVFNVGNGKELIVMYSVYASDPRNLIGTIDALVNTIKLN
jgi:hypothetical protein